MKTHIKIKTLVSSSVLAAAISNPLQAGQVTFTEIPSDITIRSSLLSNISVSDEGTVVFSHNHNLYKWNSTEGVITIGEFPEKQSTLDGVNFYTAAPYIDANISSDGQVIAYNYFSDISGGYLTHVYINDNLEHVIAPVGNNWHSNRAKDLSPDGTTLGGTVSTYNLSEESSTYIANNFIWSGQDRSYQGRNTHFSDDINKFTLGSNLVTVNEDGSFATQAIPEMNRSNFNTTYIGDISGDGNIVVGMFDTAPGRWNSSTNNLDYLNVNGNFISPISTNVDGSVIIGQYGNVWDEVNGTRNIINMLNDSGIDLSGWSYIRLSEMSKDGTYIVGYGETPEGLKRAFLITSISECTAGLF